MTDGTSDHPVRVAGRESDGDSRIVEGDPPKPPDAPVQDKRWLFYRHQLIGIPLMLLLVVTAMLGYLGESEAMISTGDDVAQMTVEHISRFRYKMIGSFDVTVENASREPLRAVVVHIDQEYLDRFSNVVFTPIPASLSSEWAVFELGDIPPGGSAVIAGEIQAESFGRHEGEVRLSADGMGEMVTSVSTLSLP